MTHLVNNMGAKNTQKCPSVLLYELVTANYASNLMPLILLMPNTAKWVLTLSPRKAEILASRSLIYSRKDEISAWKF